MFPNVNGFHWSAGHLIFLSLFGMVVLLVAGSLALAAWRSRRVFAQQRFADLRWHSDFHELPAGDRFCRHELTGEFEHRTCENAFHCGHCPTHARLLSVQPPAAATDEHPFGLSFPADRSYHRAHTWVRPEADGTVTVGLDDFAQRLLGTPDSITVPGPGDKLDANGPAWRMSRHGVEVTVRAPVDGEVVETGGPGQPYYLKLKPSGDTRHLLSGAEIRPWLSRELERLQLALTAPGGAPALADGGVLVNDLPQACPAADWEAVWGKMLLET